ncbi:MAG: 1-acyl-sn-glycerol-3-phosphate acyltransferase [Mesorhizobium sp.]|nr:lysophospholipid acyltransferase family protein [Mesorhizobium sp.]MBN9241291.1 1-acyl-sn-glycerol-3-phosphate acyltransferase [Mesorhizobium sp.]
MIAKIRNGLILLFVAAITTAVAVSQPMVLKTGWGNPALIPRLWHKAILWALGFRVHVIGAPATQRPLLVVANHISWTDIPVLGSVVDVSFIAKAQMQGWPLMGWLSTLQRTVFVERERRQKSGDQASEIGERLKAGEAMALFAEGTTGDGNMMLPFKSTLFGAATMAIDKGAIDKGAADKERAGQGGVREVTIQPMAIAYVRRHGMPLGRAGRMALSWIGDQDLVPHIAGLLKQGAVDVEVRFGEPVTFSAGSNRKEVARLVEARVKAMAQAALYGSRPD